MSDEPETGDADGDVEIDASDGLDEVELEALCAAATNHGEYVSAVARDRVGDGDGTHGERVREAAASDCGRSDDHGEPTDGEDSEDLESEGSDGDDERRGNAHGHDGDHPSTNGNAGGNGNGNAGGNGNVNAGGNGNGNGGRR